MSDLIERQAAIDALIEWYGCEPSDIDAFEDIIEKMPSAQPEVTEEAVKEYCHKRCLCIVDSALIKKYASTQPEREKGKWIYGEDDVAMCDGYHCSECGFFVPWDYKRKFIDFIKDYNFCPNCGTDMRGKQNEKTD